MGEVSQRRRARELALQVLFQKEFVADVDIETSLAYFRDHLEISQDALEYARSVLEGIERNKKEIDQILQASSRNWKISRMSPVDLSLLRIGIYELRFTDDVPPKSVINEAIEIAKRYSGTDSPQFINGVLDDILRSKN